MGEHLELLLVEPEVQLPAGPVGLVAVQHHGAGVRRQHCGSLLLHLGCPRDVRPEQLLEAAGLGRWLQVLRCPHRGQLSARCKHCLEGRSQVAGSDPVCGRWAHDDCLLEALFKVHLDLRRDLPEVEAQEALHRRLVGLEALALDPGQQAGGDDLAALAEHLPDLDEEAVRCAAALPQAQGDHEGVAHWLGANETHVALAVGNLVLKELNAPLVNDFVPEVHLEAVNNRVGQLDARLGVQARHELVDVEPISQVTPENAGLVDVPVEGRAIVHQDHHRGGEALQSRQQLAAFDAEQLTGRGCLECAQVRPDRPEGRLAAPGSGVQRQLRVKLAQADFRGQLPWGVTQLPVDQKVHAVTGRTLLKDEIARRVVQRLDGAVAEALHGKGVKEVEGIQECVPRQVLHAPGVPKCLLKGVGHQGQVLHVLHLQPLPLAAPGLHLQLDCQGKLGIHTLLV
mmetsp:Transcript_19615/g.53901  ORF Transcript_19615/g.53901 Transcript_19615/m.53901 type:complete len:455 (-) Transcript_19615:596-1960(-)